MSRTNPARGPAARAAARGARRGARRPWPAAIALAALGLAGCAVGPDFHPPAPQVPAAFTAPLTPAAGAASAAADAPPHTAAPDMAHWWRSLGDAQLDKLVEQVLTDSPTIEMALSRLQQARSFEVAVTGAALPQLGVGSGGGHGTGSNLARGGRAPAAVHAADQSAPDVAHITQASGFSAGWDVDLFGRFRREIEAARYDAQAAAAARDAVQVALVADVVRAYFGLRGYQTQVAVLQQNEEAARKLVDLVQARFDRGITNELDLTLARRQYAATVAELAPLTAQVDAARDQIAALLGRFPDDLRAELTAPAMIPPVPERIELGVPIDMLRRRPDIREAEWELGGATARIGVAIGELYPQLSLSAAVGRQRAALIGGLPSATQRIWSIGYSAGMPLLDFGTLDAIVQVADLRAQEQLYRYRQTVVQAFQDVDTSVAAFSAQQERLRSLGDAVVAGQRAMTLASERYDRGLTDFLNVVDAQRQEYQLEAQYAVAQMTVGQQYVAVFQALGGGWEGYEGPPALPLPQPAVLAIFRRMLQPAPYTAAAAAR